MSELTRPPHVAIIGAGPAGFFAADALLKQKLNVKVDLFDRLPTPYGLVRYGVAPDHEKIKSVRKVYEKIGQRETVRFLGHVTFGHDLTREDVRRHYDAVIYAVGAETDRNLGVPGEDLPQSLSATSFVAWYNGHPDYARLEMNLNAGRAAVIGNGNVAVDLVRILAKSPSELQNTDIAAYALNILARSKVTDIYMLGRRGPAQGKFTSKELRELGELANADIFVNPRDLELDPESAAALENDPINRRNVEILRAFAAQEPAGKPRRIHLKFFVSPVEILGDGAVAGLKLERNILQKSNSGYLNAVGSGVFETLPVELVFRSIGYKGTPLPGVPFDARRGVIPNREGRVQDESGRVVPGEYVVGWIKRGPSGVIGTNKADAAETVKRLAEDLPTLPRVDGAAASPQAVSKLLASRGVTTVGFKEWLALDHFEQEAGKLEGRSRTKITEVAEMLERCRGELVE
jgi:ferredoxin--NADP+ reductase